MRCDIDPPRPPFPSRHADVPFSADILLLPRKSSRMERSLHRHYVLSPFASHMPSISCMQADRLGQLSGGFAIHVARTLSWRFQGLRSTRLFCTSHSVLRIRRADWMGRRAPRPRRTLPRSRYLAQISIAHNAAVKKEPSSAGEAGRPH
jgi:hypothetical protein